MLSARLLLKENYFKPIVKIEQQKLTSNLMFFFFFNITNISWKCLYLLLHPKIFI